MPGEPGVRELHLMATERCRNVPDALPHAVPLVARPTRERDVHHPAGTRIPGERCEKPEVGFTGHEIE